MYWVRTIKILVFNLKFSEGILSLPTISLNLIFRQRGGFDYYLPKELEFMKIENFRVKGI